MTTGKVLVSVSVCCKQDLACSMQVDRYFKYFKINVSTEFCCLAYEKYDKEENYNIQMIVLGHGQKGRMEERMEEKEKMFCCCCFKRFLSCQSCAKQFKKELKKEGSLKSFRGIVGPKSVAEEQTTTFSFNSAGKALGLIFVG